MEGIESVLVEFVGARQAYNEAKERYTSAENALKAQLDPTKDYSFSVKGLHVTATFQTVSNHSFRVFHVYEPSAVIE